MSSRAVALVCVGVALVGACQGATVSDLFDPNVTIDGSVPTDATAATSSSGGESDASQTSSSSGGSSSGLPDAAPDAPVADPDLTGVECSAAGFCTGATPLCCAGRPVQGVALGPYACKAACLPAETSIDCDDQDDCGAGEVCCTTNDNEGTPQTITCKAAAACPATASQTAVCDRNKPDTCNAYNPGTRCQEFFGRLDGGDICIP